MQSLLSCLRLTKWKTARKQSDLKAMHSGALRSPLPSGRMHSRAMTVTRSAGSSQGGSGAQTGVLFVCLGNICRSPTAEAVFKSVVEKAGLAEQFDIDSCGTGGGAGGWYKPGGFSYHEGDAADPRMTAAAAQRGVKLTSRSRPLTAGDLSRFEYIIGMDASNMRSILTAADFWASNGSAAPPLDEVRGRVTLMTDYCSGKHPGEVPDPYYGGPQGFETVLDLLEDASTGLLAAIQKDRAAAAAGAAKS